MRQEKEGCAELARYAEESTVRIFRTLVGQGGRSGEILDAELADLNS